MWCLMHFVCHACRTVAVFKVRGTMTGTEVQLDGGEVVENWIASHYMPEPVLCEINV